ncbi:hypothetical protein N657DRAFT_664076 [Parathielavia appendiculata]|uniref:RRM domain-containing protein n=1 Tax=Parathielavia appendiculata TaxID=2587402 RepID=A0AAN6Z3K6_9PEZI|nr:hypothetical protein N657DRAFT_664076 [Parathielavia appendiculata]
MVANGKSSGKVAADFEKMIHEARERKKAEALAAKIFNRDRTPTSAAGTLVSRAGVKKPRAEPQNRARPRQSTSNIDGEWTHDLHETQSRGGPKANGKASGSGAGSLAARITDPSAPPTGPAGHKRQQRRAAQVAQALIRSELQSPRGAHQGQQQRQQQGSFAINGAAPTAPKAMLAASKKTFNPGITIRGLAGPFVVMAQNFAPGTTAADIESAMTPVGGIITTCRLVKTHPIVIAEIVFESKEGADNVIATFNNQTADGRVLSVYPKVGNNSSALSTQTQNRASLDTDMVVDGSYGFDDPVDTTYSNNSRQPPTGPAAGVGGGLYSDSLVKTNRWGRGFSRAGQFGGR